MEITKLKSMHGFIESILGEQYDLDMLCITLHDHYSYIDSLEYVMYFYSKEDAINMLHDYFNDFIWQTRSNLVSQLKSDLDCNVFEPYKNISIKEAANCTLVCTINDVIAAFNGYNKYKDNQDAFYNDLINDTTHNFVHDVLSIV